MKKVILIINVVLLVLVVLFVNKIQTTVVAASSLKPEDFSKISSSLLQPDVSDTSLVLIDTYGSAGTLLFLSLGLFITSGIALLKK